MSALQIAVLIVGIFIALVLSNVVTGFSQAGFIIVGVIVAILAVVGGSLLRR